MDKVKLKKREENQKRSNVLKNWFSSFFMTVGVVIVVVAFVPKSPQVTIESIQEFSQEVLYRVNVVDEDLAIIEDSLVISLENQFEHYEQPLVLGVTTGVFSNLTETTVYTVKVLADKGFGLEVLSKQQITTKDVLGAGVISNLLTSPPESQTLNYQISTYASDPFDEVQAFYLDVYTISENELDPYSYLLGRYPLQEGISSVELSGIYSSNLTLQYQIIGVTDTGEQIFYEYTFHTPVVLWASLYLNQVTFNTASFGAYVEVIPGLDIQYEIRLYRHGKLIDTIDVTPHGFDDHMQQESSHGYTFEGLTRSTLYDVELVAMYTDYNTYVYTETTIQSLTFETTRIYQYTASVTETETGFVVQVDGMDPDNVFNQVTFTIYQGYEMDGEMYYYYYTSTTFDLFYDGDNSFRHEVIDKQIFMYYRIVVSVNDSEIYEVYQDLATIEHLLNHDTITIH